MAYVHQREKIWGTNYTNSYKTRDYRNLIITAKGSKILQYKPLNVSKAHVENIINMNDKRALKKHQMKRIGY